MTHEVFRRSMVHAFNAYWSKFMSTETTNLWERAKEALGEAARMADVYVPFDESGAKLRALLAEMEQVECVEGHLNEDGEWVGPDISWYGNEPALLLLLPEKDHE